MRFRHGYLAKCAWALAVVLAIPFVNSESRADEAERYAEPKLPAQAFDYSNVNLPPHVIQTDLAATDNTPRDNPITDAGATLGRVLFYDRQLSKNNSTSCASCHVQKHGFSDPRRFSKGFAGGLTKRNSMGLVNLRYTNVEANQPGFFWDERAETLEAQVLMPIQDKIEMGMDLVKLEKKLAKIAYYPGLFRCAFGSTDVSRDRIAQALAQFVRSMGSFNSRFDQGAAAESDLSEGFENFSVLENRGKSIFIDGIGDTAEFACAMCHVPPTFNMASSANIGLDLVYKDKGLGALNRPPNDKRTPTNDGKFKAPSLRNIALTAPYMHDGRFKTLGEVVEHYSTGVYPHKDLGLVFEIQPGKRPTAGFNFTKNENAALVAFLKTLTDRSIVSDRKFSDPFLRALQ
jgi:cytochrome c peroxidase